MACITVGIYTVSGAQTFFIPYSSLHEQTGIVEILSDMGAEIAALEAKLAKARHRSCTPCTPC